MRSSRFMSWAVGSSALVLAVATPVAQASSSSGAGMPTDSDTWKCAPGVTQLPLVPGATAGAVIGGRGERLLLGGEDLARGVGSPMVWRRHGCHRWTVTDLSDGGRIEGGAESIAADGSILIGTGYVRTRNGAYHRLKAFPGFDASDIHARQMNRHGVITGEISDADGVPHGAMWRSWRSAPRHLRPLPFPGSADSYGAGINDLGDITGNSCNADCSTQYGGVWPRGSTHGFVVPGLGGSPYAAPWRVNNRRTLAGGACDAACDTFDATVWYHLRHPHSVGTLPGDVVAVFLALSNNGRAAGVSSVSDGGPGRVAYWPGHGPLRTLPPLRDLPYSIAHYVSNHGLVAGASFSTETDGRPTVWNGVGRLSYVPKASGGAATPGLAQPWIDRIGGQS
jgi:hypothetical protein